MRTIPAPHQASRSRWLCCAVLAGSLSVAACESTASHGGLDAGARGQRSADQDEGEGEEGDRAGGDGDEDARDDEQGDDQGDGDSSEHDAGMRPKPRSDGGAKHDAGETDEEEQDAGPGEPTDPFASLRQACLDTINQYRATLKRPPLKRAPDSEELCSDQGAKYDYERKQAHGSAAAGALACRKYGVAQNTCPNYAYRNGDREGAMKRCLQQMWNEGEPPGGVEKCVEDYFNGQTACFLAHGHYINMENPDTKTVSCGFYDDGKVLWMNQDFR